MAHPAQVQYCTEVKAKHPKYFTNVDVLDVWSMDINGNNRYLFDGYTYAWIDVWPGPNVDYICSWSVFDIGKRYDTVISTEMLEHNKYWKETLQNMYKLLKDEWLLIFTCAWEGRAEHWTTRTTPDDAPFTNDYYRNVNEAMLREALNLEELFSEFEVSNKELDFRFYWIKKCK